MERTSRGYLTAGSYTVRVEAQRVNGATQFTLDDYLTNISLIAP